MSTLAHVFEAAGMATIVLASMRSVVERMAVPRALYCEFPLGRPLGRPNDPSFQHDVLSRAFALLAATEPTVADHPEVVVADEAPLACPIPPHHEPAEHPAVAEARGLRPAFDRTFARRRATSVGRVVGPDEIPSAIAALVAMTKADDPSPAHLPGRNSVAVAHDVRAYYEEAACALVDGDAPAGRALESWFYRETEAGRVVLAARAAFKDADVAFDEWFYMAPAQR